MLYADSFQPLAVILCIHNCWVETSEIPQKTQDSYPTDRFPSAIATAIISRLYLDLQAQKVLRNWKEHFYGLENDESDETELQVRGKLLPQELASSAVDESATA